MNYKVDFKEVSTVGLEDSTYPQALAGLRANEARYFWNKYKHEFVTIPAKQDLETIGRVNQILQERDLKFEYEPLEVSRFQVNNIDWSYIFYQNGLSINVMYDLENPKNRAVGFKLAEGMEIPKEFEGKFKFARQKSKLAGIIRGSYFVIKNEY